MVTINIWTASAYITRNAPRRLATVFPANLIKDAKGKREQSIDICGIELAQPAPVLGRHSRLLNGESPSEAGQHLQILVSRLDPMSRNGGQQPRPVVDGSGRLAAGAAHQKAKSSLNVFRGDQGGETGHLFRGNAGQHQRRGDLPNLPPALFYGARPGRCYIVGGKRVLAGPTGEIGSDVRLEWLRKLRPRECVLPARARHGRPKGRPAGDIFRGPVPKGAGRPKYLSWRPN